MKELQTPTTACGCVTVDKATFLRTIASHEIFREDRHQRPDSAGEVTTAYRLRSGVELGRTVECPRLPLSRPTRYFLLQTFTPV